MRQEGAAAPPRQPLSSSEAQDGERALSAGETAVQCSAGGLGGVLDHDGARFGREMIHFREIDGTAVQVHDDDRRRALSQSLAYLRKVRGERVRVDIVEQDRRVGTIGSRGYVVASIGRKRDRGAPSSRQHAEERGGQGRGAAIGQQHRLRSVARSEERDHLLLRPPRSAVAHRSTHAREQCGHGKRRVNGRLVSPTAHGRKRTTRGPSRFATASGSRRHSRGPQENAGSSGEGVACSPCRAY